MATSKDECLVRDIKLRKGHSGPILVNFEHGMLKKNESTDLKCSVFTANDKSKVCTIAAIAKEGDVVYQGDVHSGDGDLCRTFLAVRNKKSNKMRIYEAGHAMLSPTVASNVTENIDAQERKQAIYNLSHAFGSKRNKRIADQKARMEVNVESVKDKLSNTVHDIEVKASDIETVVDDTYTQLLPPCDREAKTPAEVYKISDLLEENELRSLEDYYSKAVEEESLNTSKMSQFYKLMSNIIAPGNVQKHALLLYAECLINFCNRRDKDVSDLLKKILCPYSKLINKRIVKDFLIVHGRTVTRSKSMVDKAVMYIIIIGLHVGAFQVDLDVVASSISKIDINRIKMLARVIGLVSAKNQATLKNLNVLKVPLPKQQSLLVNSRKSRK